MMPSFRLIRLTHLLLLIVLCGYLLILGKPLLIPMAFAVLLAFLLKPIVVFLEKRIGRSGLSIAISLILGLIPAIIIIWFFSLEISKLISSLGGIDSRLQASLDRLFDLASNITGLEPSEEKLWINQQLTGFLNSSFGILTVILASSTTFFAGFLFTGVITFFLLYYRHPFREFIVLQFPLINRGEVGTSLKSIQVISRKYIYGLCLLTLLLGTLYTIGLWIIGIPYAPFWGFLMGIMNIIPFIGNLLGLIFLMLYALAVTGQGVTLLVILGLHLVMQTIEGNVLRPLIVGNTVNVNPFVAIISILVGGFVWGLAGIVLALPFTAMFKVVCDQINYLKPLGALLDANISTKGGLGERFDGEQYRIIHYLNRKADN